MDISRKKGNYVIVWKLEQDCGCFTPRFGNVNLESGYYFYCGSAHGSGGLKARALRHVKPSERKRWHIDYIKEKLAPLEVWWEETLDKNECKFARFLNDLNQTTAPIPGFGASDCQNRCEAHLIYASPEIEINRVFLQFKKKFQNISQTTLEDLLR